MQLRQHIDNPWYRAKHVSVSKAEITCVLDQRRPYDLAQAYQYGPHVELLNLSCDQDWAGFVARWGPLLISEVEQTQGRSRMQLDRCWAFQRRFKSYAELLEGFGHAHLEGEKLRNFLKASEEESKSWGLGSPATATVPFLAWLQNDPLVCQLFEKASVDCANLDEGFPLWLRIADQQSVRQAVAYVIRNVSFAGTGSLVAEWKGVRPRITARVDLGSLGEALEWMLWNSYWMKKPQIFCQECQRAFWPESAHPRKYCSHECAHRATDRAWRRKQRAQEKKGG